MKKEGHLKMVFSKITSSFKVGSKFLISLRFLAIVAVFLYSINGSVLSVLALSDEKGSDPSGFSQRYVIERAPWYDPTDCAGGAGDTGASGAAGGQELEGRKLPASEGGVATEARIDETGKFLDGNLSERVTFTKFAALGQEYRDYYITMRWPYVEWAWNGVGSNLNQSEFDWYNNQQQPRRVTVTNPENGKSIVAVVLEAGPAPWTGTKGGQGDAQQRDLWGAPRRDTPAGYQGRVGGLPPKAMEALGAKTWLSGGPDVGGSGSKLKFAWTQDQNAKPGPTNAAAGGGAKTGKLYLIGDSITEDAGINKGLKDKLKADGYTDVVINSKASRALRDGSGNLDGIGVLKRDQAQWTNANTIVVELGTNGGIDAANIRKTVDTIKAGAPNASIYWVNVGANNSTRTTGGPIDTDKLDSILKENSSLGYKVIDWNSVVKQKPTLIVSDGLGVHPYTEEGRKAYVDTISKSLGGNANSEVGNTTCTCPTGVTDNGFSGNNNVEIAFNFFNGREGIDAIHAAAIVGNFMLESGGNTTIDPNITNSIGAFGIAQWLSGRKTGLINFARQRGKQPNDLQIQLEYTIFEVTQTGERAGFQRFLKTTTVKDAAVSWENNFERSGGEGIPQRINNSEKVFQQYGKNAPSGVVSSSNSTPTDCNNQEGGLGQGPNGFVFPLRTTKSVIRRGTGAVWCFDRPTGGEQCHGSYPAADIFAPTGTPVLAAVGGRVVNTKNNCTKNCSLTIKGDDQYLYFYIHMGAGTVTAKIGDIIKAGQEIGKVGTAADAENTTPHLHFDIFNKSYDRHPPCGRGPGRCPNKGDMIDPQPPLTASFKNLPE